MPGRCYRRARTGFRHGRNSFFDSLGVSGKDECSAECGLVSYCKSFSYEYFASASSRNCLLSRIDVGTFVNYDAEDFESNSNWDVYEFLDEDRECRNGAGGGGTAPAKSLISKCLQQILLISLISDGKLQRSIHNCLLSSLFSLIV